MTLGAVGSKRAAELLEGKKGEAILQRGYAFLNMAGQFDGKGDPRAVAAAAESRKIFRAYPYTTARDIADAAALDAVVRITFEKKLKEADFHAAWKQVKAARCSELVRPMAFDFVLNYLMFMKQAYPDQYPAARTEVEEWALPEFFSEVAALVDTRLGA